MKRQWHPCAYCLWLESLLSGWQERDPADGASLAIGGQPPIGSVPYFESEQRSSIDSLGHFDVGGNLFPATLAKNAVVQGCWCGGKVAQDRLGVTQQVPNSGKLF